MNRVAWVASLALICACSGKSSSSGDAGDHPGDAGPTGDGAPATSCTAIPAAETGDGTYYDADGTGNCSFDASPDDLMVAAMNEPDYGDAVWCGACVDVTGPAGEVVVRIVDKCPGCSHGDLDLSPQAFQQISPLAAGRVKITWHEVPCDVTGPISYFEQDGSSQFYTAVQIRNARFPIDTVEALGSDGTFTPIARVDYNFFVATKGLGVGPYTLRVTDQRGHVLTDTGLTLTADQSTAGGAQFPACTGD